jgi:Ni,Fe-hydrogenase III small subunit
VELAVIRERNNAPALEYCHNAFHGGELDELGIDIVISVRSADGLVFLLQVKSSADGLERHYERHPLIPAMIVNKHACDREIVETILGLMQEQIGIPFTPEELHIAGRSLELKKWLGADALVVLQNGFGILLRKESSEPASHFSAIKIQDDWDGNEIPAELLSVVERYKDALSGQFDRR